MVICACSHGKSAKAYTGAPRINSEDPKPPTRGGGWQVGKEDMPTATLEVTVYGRWLGRVSQQRLLNEKHGIVQFKLGTEERRRYFLYHCQPPMKD